MECTYLFCLHYNCFINDAIYWNPSQHNNNNNFTKPYCGKDFASKWRIWELQTNCRLQSIQHSYQLFLAFSCISCLSAWVPEYLNTRSKRTTAQTSTVLTCCLNAVIQSSIFPFTQCEIQLKNIWEMKICEILWNHVTTFIASSQQGHYELIFQCRSTIANFASNFKINNFCSFYTMSFQWMNMTTN